MSNTNTLEIRPHVAVIDGTIKTNSLKIAEHFGKRHNNVLRDIEKIIEQTADLPEALRFEHSEYEYQNNLGLTAKAKMYEMDKDGFMLVVMGYTGSKAMAIKIAYINAFNAMERQLLAAPQNQPGLTYATKADRKPLVKAVRNLVKTAESKGRSLSYSDAHSIINLKMGVIDVEHLSVDQIPQAMALVGELLERIVLEGDYLPRNTAATSPALPAGPELLTQNDMSNLQSVIWKITQTLPLRDRFIQTIWCSLRLATNNPSPAPFTVDHLPVIVDDLRRVSRMIHLFSNQVSNAQCDLLQSILAASPEQSNDAAIGDIRALLHKLDIMEADRMSHRISQYCERSIAALGERRQARAIPARAAENAALQFSI